MTDKITIERDILEHTVVALEYAYDIDDEMAKESIKSLRAALVQEPCCEQYATCNRACTPRGRWLGRREAESERSDRAKVKE